ncbi:SDR family oxidoreductase [Actinokineospora soli]|uniref:SDR family oxidoreductase n=1 Tax=Actinokineospora soli TaxID=1048753 RepID=A0ABW2TL55_9PSEU
MGSVAPLPGERVGAPMRAVVTGADSGIGKATAVALARGGVDVGITWHSDDEGVERTRAEVEGSGVRAVVARLDLSDLPAAAETIDRLADDLGGIDVLVNNAGMGSSTPVMELDYAAWRKVLSVDLDGAFLCAQRAARRMIDAGRGGRIINVTSVHEHAPRVGAAAYCAAKAGLGMVTKVMAMELAEHGITVNSVAPGEIATPMNDDEDVDPRTIARPGVPLGRPGHADEVASVIAFLTTPAAGYVTGASFVVDGGMLLMGPQASERLTDDDWRG